MGTTVLQVGEVPPPLAEALTAKYDALVSDLENPDFGEVAKAMGLWGRSVSKAGDLEESI